MPKSITTLPRSPDIFPLCKLSPALIARCEQALHDATLHATLEKRLEAVLAAGLDDLTDTVQSWLAILRAPGRRNLTTPLGYLTQRAALLCAVLSTQRKPEKIKPHQVASWEVLAYARGDKTVNWGADPDYNS